MDSKIEHILIKYLSKSANASELDVLENWIQEPKNQQIFKEFAKTHYEITYGMVEENGYNAKEQLLAKIRTEKRSNRKVFINRYLKYAAVVVVMIGSAYFIRNFLITSKASVLQSPTEKHITLELEDGTLKVLSKNDSVQNITNTNGEQIGTKNGRMLVYSGGESQKETTYNILKVPYGKRFDLTLSDGSTVYLNAGSELRYPVLFPKNGNRQVKLIGEAFFNVTENTEKPFIITADKLSIQVYGTSFNVANYPEDDASEVVLVEGSVGLSSTIKTEKFDTDTLLRPGEKGSLKKNTGELTAKSVSTEIYTAWTQGKLIFRNMALENILKKLERHYDVSINNKNESLGREKFNANFGDEPLERVLQYFETTYGIRYTIDGNNISIQ